MLKNPKQLPTIQMKRPCIMLYTNVNGNIQVMSSNIVVYLIIKFFVDHSMLRLFIVSDYTAESILRSQTDNPNELVEILKKTRNS